MTFKQYILDFAEKQGFKKLVLENNKIVNQHYRDGTKEIDENIIIEAINYSRDIPFDSFDRLYALYLIENHKEDVLDKYDIDLAIENEEYAKNQYNKVIKEEYEEYLHGLSYENYEREGISNLVSFVNMVHIAKKGTEAVLNDSYANGGWFGAS